MTDKKLARVFIYDLIPDLFVHAKRDEIPACAGMTCCGTEMGKAARQSTGSFASLKMTIAAPPIPFKLQSASFQRKLESRSRHQPK
jgi:hypothetical protein